MSFNIINFKKEFSNKFYKYSNFTMDIYREYEDYLIFIERFSDNSVKLYNFNKNTRDISLICFIENQSNFQEEWISIESLSSEEIIYSIGGKDKLGIYKYNIESNKKTKLYEELIDYEDYLFSIKLDKIYTLIRSKKDLYLLNIKTLKKYRIEDSKLYFEEYEHMRVIVKDKKKYLIFINDQKSILDRMNYDDLYYEDKDIFIENNMSLYVIDFDVFIEGVKNKNKNISYLFKEEFDNYSYIDGIYNIGNKKDYLLKDKYYYIKFDYRNNKFSLYKVVLDKAIGVEELVSIENTKEIKNIVASDYPVRIYSNRYFNDKNKFEVLYPERISYENESFIDITEDIIITYTEDYEGIKYKETVKIRNKKDLSLLESYEGNCYVLSNREDILIY